MLERWRFHPGQQARTQPERVEVTLEPVQVETIPHEEQHMGMWVPAVGTHSGFQRPD
jgi:hypothetical protein